VQLIKSFILPSTTVKVSHEAGASRSQLGKRHGFIGIDYKCYTVVNLNASVSAICGNFLVVVLSVLRVPAQQFANLIYNRANLVKVARLVVTGLHRHHRRLSR
jgi:hypothetical protein